MTDQPTSRSSDLQKLRLELLTFSSGFVSVFASSSERFLGEAQTQYGPAYAFSISLIWLGTFLYVITRRNTVLPVSIREAGPEASGHRAADGDSDESNLRLVWVLLIPWFATVMIWFSGVFLHHKATAHKIAPAYQIIKGYAGYRSFGTNIFDYRPVRGAVIVLQYADRLQEVVSDGSGYFAFAIDPKPGFHAITLTCTKDNHQLETQFFDIHDLSETIIEIQMQPSGQ